MVLYQNKDRMVIIIIEHGVVEHILASSSSSETSALNDPLVLGRVKLNVQVYTLLSVGMGGSKVSLSLVPVEELTSLPSCLIHWILGDTTRCGTVLTWQTKQW